MSRGLGVVQQAILQLIASDSSGAWTIAQICRHVYPGLRWVEKKHRVAVIRALRRTKLPGTWETARYFGSTELWLCDPCNLASVKVAHGPFCDPSHFEPGGLHYATCERAKRFRDGSPLERVKMRIEDEQKLASYMKDTGWFTSEQMAEVAGRIALLVKERDALMASARTCKPV
jgi:hypothetical protein